MNIYEINEQILSLVDPETGEITDFETFNALELQRDTKIKNIAFWYKNLMAESAAIKEEEKSLSERRKRNENNAERLKQYLSDILCREKFSTSKVALSWRKSESVNIENESQFIEWAQKNNDKLLTYQQPKISKTEIKAALKIGADIPFVEIKETQNIQIK